MREIFIRGAERGSRAWNMPAGLYNCMHLLHSRAKDPALLVPIRSIQYLAVIDHKETLFVDNLGGYLMRNGQGGRPVVLAWRHYRPQLRQSLREPVLCEAVYYTLNAERMMQRLVTAFYDALKQMQAQAERTAGKPEGVILYLPPAKHSCQQSST